ncbi:hypothetical protein ACGRT8_02720 [Candidatus Phytoplasma australasiaticum]
MIINENILKKYLSTSIPKNLKFLINNHITEVDKIESIHPQLKIKNNQKYIIGKIIQIIHKTIKVDIGINIVSISLNNSIDYDKFLINKKIIILIEHNSPNFNITNNKNPFTNTSSSEIFVNGFLLLV